MKVILLGELRGKGGEGDVIDVADGFANNWLFPQKIAIQATPGNLKQLEQRRKGIEAREAVRLADANAAKEQLEGKVVRVNAVVGDEGQLFGSVTNVQVAEAVKEQLGIDVDRKRVVLNQPIKTAGTHEVPVSLYREITATLTVMVGDEEFFKAADAAATEAEAEEAPAEETAEEAVEA